jgi:hypothetical protein
VSAAAEEARHHFAALWQAHAPAWREGLVQPLAMRDGVCVPLDFCVTTIARVVDQAAPAPELDAAVERLRAAAPGQFVYGAGQRHITLVGCTPRFVERRALAPERIRRIRDTVATVLADEAPVAFDLDGVGVLGAQVFVQVVPRNRRWQLLRERLAAALAAAGEAPQVHASAAPIHLNVLRVTDAGGSALAPLFAAIESLRRAPIGCLVVSRIALVLTDFVVTPGHTADHAAFALGSRLPGLDRR